MRNVKKGMKIATLCLFCFLMTGCGNNDNNATTEAASDNSAMENAGTMVENVVDDVVDGTANMVDDLVGNDGFQNYNDAHSYFLETMGAYHSDAQFELREENENLTDYQEGSKGYQFKLYDKSKNADGEFFGEFYVDANSGVIYKKGNDQTFSEYPTSAN